ncbi:hypothetical protein BDN70DRAFT_880759 [Pholiota conissans]|uniref:Shikimate dehydrogenase substrate binding N-terminal domain-containing protein n=1 Tax=Pholiota conissans TaxID=109636 RepID=A0A9P6CYU1_9AGAR|nr:hypothetical protein BDN70DRAFT_880759 [Pholiota conissans]
MAVELPPTASEATVVEPKRFHLFGYPIAHSAAPAFHNECFAAAGLPHSFANWSTSAVTNEILSEIRADVCGGAAVTMPLKAAILEHLDELTPASKATGACNTIVKVRRADGTFKVVGTNTDVLGVRNALLQTLKKQDPTHSAFQSNADISKRFEPGSASALVIGGGATTRSAIYALSQLGLQPIFLLNRDDDEVRGVIESFQVQHASSTCPELLHIRDMTDVKRYFESGSRCVLDEEQGEGRERRPNLAIIVGAIPAIPPATLAEHRVHKLAQHIISLPHGKLTISPSPTGPSATCFLPFPSPPIFLDMAYKPRLTVMLRIAADNNWDTVGGIQAMIEQGLAQQRMWTLASVDDSVACAGASLLGEDVERRARALVEGMEDIAVDLLEVDRATS